MNTKAIYAAGGGIAVVAIAIFFFLGSGNLGLPSVSLPSLPGSQQNAGPVQAANLQIALKNISVTKVDDKHANVEAIFTAHNPNTSTVTLETIHYTVYVDKYQMTLGDIGTIPEGFVGDQANTFPIVGNNTITLRDKEVSVRNNLTSGAWDSMVDGTAKYRVEGAYSFRLIGSDFQTSYGDEVPFNMTFP